RGCLVASRLSTEVCMSRSTLSRLPRILSLGALCVATAFSGGCNNNKKSQSSLDAAMAENAELRGRIESLEQALRDCDTQKASLEQQLAATSPMGNDAGTTG